MGWGASLMFDLVRVFEHHGRFNIKPGQLINLDEVTEVYRQEHLKSEERKALRLMAKQALEQQTKSTGQT